MKLESARLSFNEASEKDIDEVFDDDAGRGEFVILQAGEGRYIQAGGEGEGPYVLEYRESASDPRYQATQSLGKAEVKAVFLDYFRHGSSWKTNRDWKAIDVPRRGCLAPSLSLFLIFVLWLIVRWS
jgi:hypothetical protein